MLDFDSIDRGSRSVLLKLLTTRYRSTVVAIGTRSAIEDAEALGVVATVRKPLNVGVLMGHVERIVGTRQDA